MKKAAKIFIVILIGVLITIAYYYVVDLIISDFALWLKIVIYLFIMFLIIGPFLPRKGKKKTFFSEMADRIQSTASSTESVRFKLRPKVNLDVSYTGPLISKCRCGFILTSHMKKCPQCGRDNIIYGEHQGSVKGK